jgi:hypothetical protein
VEGLAPHPEDEFLTNALQHLREDNLRLALIEATVSLEIVLSQCLKAYLTVRRHFSTDRITSVLNNVGLTSQVGLVLELIFTPDERKEAKLESVLKAIKWRNGIIHKTGHLPVSTPEQEIKDCIYAMLNLSLQLAERREKLRVEPELHELARRVGEKFKVPIPTIDALMYHCIRVKFDFPGHNLLFPHKATPVPIPNAEIMRKIVGELELMLKVRDPMFNAAKHLAVFFGRYPDVVFASLENGEEASSC